LKACEELLATHRGSSKEFTGLKQAAAIMKAVESAVVNAQLDIDELTVAAAADGTITMFGLVQSEETIRRATEVAQSVPQVTRVFNSMIVR